jgi:hypothetical protein
MLRRLDGHMAQEELDRFELAARQVTETRTCASQIVGARFSIPAALGRSLDDLFRNPRKTGTVSSVPPQRSAGSFLV